MNWLLHPIRDFLIWMFENTLEPLGNAPNTVFICLILGGLVYWMFVQNRLNKKARNCNWINQRFLRSTRMSNVMEQLENSSC